MQVLSIPNPGDHAITIRAKALAFEDAQSKLLLERIRLIAPSDATVLVTGESGTGKELIARLVHTLSDRRDGPFVAINCGAFSENLIESELFGHERGAFTGAVDSRQGWFEASNTGTLFLDEVGDLPLAAQVKLLRVLQEREVVRVGSRTPIKIDVRLVAATNLNLEAAVRAGNFREDLYYRLNVAKLALLPLRDRPDDILPLAGHFIDLYVKRLRVPAPGLSSAARRSLLAYSWPGNIRELENVIHHSLLISQGKQIEAEDLSFSSLGSTLHEHAETRPLAPADGNEEPADACSVRSRLSGVLMALFEEHSADLWQDIEAAVFNMAYEYSGQNQVHTARLLGLTRNVVRNRLHQFVLSKTGEVVEERKAFPTY